MKKEQMKKLVLLIPALLFVYTPVASAAEYSYWGYWHGANSEWTMADTGATFVPADGSVEGWRFVKTAGDEMPAAPQAPADFEALCGDTPAEAGSKRVGIVIDYGTVEGSGSESLETKTECAVVPAEADGFAVLDAVSSSTSDSGMVSCIDGVPSGTCPTATTALTTSAPVEEEKQNYTAVGAVVLLTLLASAVAVIRRKRSN